MSDLGVAKGRVVIDTSDVRRAQNEVQGASRVMSQALGAIGVGVGLREITRFAVEADKVATAYRRQSVAARELAGSQGQLNALLRTYSDATGGAIGKAQSLADVTRLLAVGFADSVDELDEFARAARGISIATGQSQDYIISQLQLAIANQSTLRLDQLGLGVSEVKQRIDELKASNKSLTDEMAYQQAILGLAEDKFGDLADSAEAGATGMERLRKAWDDLTLEFGSGAGGGTNIVFNQWASDIERATNELAQFSEFLEDVASLGRQFRFNIGLSNPPAGMAAPPVGPQMRPPGAPSQPRSVAASRWGENQKAVETAITEWSRSVQDIERQANRDRLDATRQYEQQRSDTIRDYGKTIAREAEDFARSRLRQEEDFAKSLADIRQAAAQREERMAEDLARNIARARADSAERLADMQEQLDRTVSQRRADSAERVAEWEEDRQEALAERRKDSTERLLSLEEEYTKERERAQRDHRDRLLDAAAQFDAYAIAQEQRRFAREQEERKAAQRDQVSAEQEGLAEAVAQLEEAHRERLQDEQQALDKSIRQAVDAYDRQVADEKEALDKRIAQANEAYALQLEDARAADAQRIEDMTADFAERKRREDEDRRTRLTRMAEDHNDQLNEMARQHGLRLTQIEEHAREERQTLDDEFQKELDALGIRTDAWTEKQTAITDFAIKEFDRWWEHISAIATGLSQSPYAPGYDPLYPTPTTDPVVSASASGGVVTTSMGGVTFNIYQQPGQSSQDLVNAIDQYMRSLGPDYQQ